MEKVIVEKRTNLFGAIIKRWCGSCAHKCILKDGTRFCANMQLKVEQNFVCNQWEMSDGMKSAGYGVGVVRLRGTGEVIINNEY